MGEEKTFVWRDSYPEGFGFPSMPDKPVGRYREIFEGYKQHLPEEYRHVEQTAVPENLIEDMREKGIYSDNLDRQQQRFRDMILTAASDTWLGKLLDRSVESYSSPDYTDEHLEAHILAAEGTREAAEQAIENDENSFHNGGGHHHASRGGSSDLKFNMINDEAAGIEYLKNELEEPTALVVDLDLHFGDGTIAIYRDDPDVYHFSMHEWNNFPGNLSSGDLDYTGSGNAEGTKVNVPLESGTAGDIYLSIVNTALEDLMDEADPDIVFYQAGVDPHHEDPLGDLNLTLKDLYKRDRAVEKHSGDVPVVGMTGGGYGPKAGQASVNTVAALSGNDIVFEEDSLSEEEKKKAVDAEKKARVRYRELLDNPELGFLT